MLRESITYEAQVSQEWNLYKVGSAVQRFRKVGRNFTRVAETFSKIEDRIGDLEVKVL